MKLVDQVEDAGHGGRHFLAGLEDEAVAAGDGVGQEPERDHAGEVERRDGGDDAERLAQHMLVDATGDVFGVVAHHQRGNARRHLDVLDAAPQLALRLRQRLAALLRRQAGDLVKVFFE